MQISCNGYDYDTATAKHVASSPDNGRDESGWQLYRTPRGSYFRVTYGHGGEEVAFLAVTHEHANQLMFQGDIVR